MIDINNSANSSPLVRALETHIRALGLPEPTMEHRFHDSRKWRFDMAWPEHMIGVECEGAAGKVPLIAQFHISRFAGAAIETTKL